MGKLLLWVLACAACANNVPQDRSTGPDGAFKGAKEIALEDNSATAKGIVTYPGGDRIDWRKIVLPEKAHGRLDLQMTYTTPRPDLKLSFDVFDQYARPLKQTASGRGRNKSLTIDDASGTYYVRIFAQRRGDAGAYKLVASFAPTATEVPFDDKMPVPDPPKLPTIPDPPPTECPVYDKSNAICATVCAPNSPANHKPCATSTPEPLPPQPQPPTPPPAAPTKPVVGRIVNVTVEGDGTLKVTVSAGTETGVGKDWKGGSLLKGDGKDLKAKYPNGGITVERVDRRATIVKLRRGITADVIGANGHVVLEP